MTLYQQQIKKKNGPDKDSIIFSSEDSFNSDYSFNSSVLNDNNNGDQNNKIIYFFYLKIIDYKNTFFHLKEQMNQLFQQTPELQDNLKFDQMYGKENEQEESQIQQSQKPIYQNQETEEKKQKEKEFKQKSKLWQTLSNNIIRNSHYQSKIPSLEALNHRLNIFKQNIEKIDYLEFLTKENKQQTQKDENINENNINRNNIQTQNNNVINSNYLAKNNDSENSQTEEQFDLNGEIKYYSYKMKIEQQQRELRQKQLEISLKKKRLQSEKRKNILSFDNSKEIIQLQDKIIQLNQKNSLKKDQFKTNIGKALFQALQQSKGDKEMFRKIAYNTLKEYNRSKQNLFKNKKFPPQIPKFIQEDNKFLNQFLPDFNNPLFERNKGDPFEFVKEYQPDICSQEYEQLQIIEHISKGKFINLWKDNFNE
ncbi:hypothetical protein IMG5_127770 [Ichthyophthirius multifiliis]|uniref:Uncharacterized protein n=1 Tax=Ichthyophthirius multifiliis TaxID=5932 RepID=G0QVZ0_ICHMU|nr:hypothetical protein IMG5_127770 [Ichthyophthirius multifiliis]EGR30615.1 hypothetical protein IMG5_127770 [Ichthyophthirius multifiliis]|eukprot:XP_004032202.1 hypothetical protein IMG5_127770 [Ichthyophthirius multifiliis]